VPKNVASWYTHRNNNYDWLLVAIGDPQRQYKIWLSYTFDYIFGEGETKAARHFDNPFMWGEFMSLRNDGPREDDPQFPPEKSPDILFYSGGYHASTMTASQYGAAIEEALHQYQGALKDHHVQMPQFHLMLNAWKVEFLSSIFIPNQLIIIKPLSLPNCHILQRFVFLNGIIGIVLIVRCCMSMNRILQLWKMLESMILSRA
jgi:hypothetical protein